MPQLEGANYELAVINKVNSFQFTLILIIFAIIISIIVIKYQLKSLYKFVYFNENFEINVEKNSITFLSNTFTKKIYWNYFHTFQKFDYCYIIGYSERYNNTKFLVVPKSLIDHYNSVQFENILNNSITQFFLYKVKSKE